MRGQTLYRALARTRTMLNRRRAAAAALSWGAVAMAGAVAISLPCLVLNWIDRTQALMVALSFSGLGLLAGGLHSLRERLSLRNAATWLDRSIGAAGLYSSALACVDRSASAKKGPFDDAIIDRAEARLAGIREARVPVTFLMTPALTWVGAALAMSIVLALPFSRTAAFIQSDAKEAAAVAPLSDDRNEKDSAADKAIALGTDQPSPEELAGLLFPNQPELARLLADALKSGRLDEARDLVDKAELARTDLEQRRGPGVGLPEGEPSAKERLENAIRVIEEGPTGSGDIEREAGTEGGQGSTRDGGDYNGEAAPMESTGNGKQDSGTDGNAVAQGGSAPGSGSGDGTGGAGAENPAIGESAAGTSAGSGSGSAREWSAIDPLASGGTAEIAPLQGGAYFELVLPGNDPTVSPGDRARAALAAAEEAMARSSLPTEYQDSIREYFLQLIEESDRAGGL
ncbi:MAG: hypothetical protein E4H20_05465 [Spirochaetales bacterium]|nr:MAG: hypothetical protein E4H20_05465 [Spirochaetales bacterium]